MTRHQRHLRQIGYIPCTDDQTAAIGIFFYLLNQFTDLVNHFSILSFPAAPLFAIYRAKVAIFIGPFIPDLYTMFFQISNIGLAFQKPEQFINNTFQMTFFVVTSGNPFCRSNRIWYPKQLWVPVPVRSVLCTPFSKICWSRSRYCCILQR